MIVYLVTGPKGKQYVGQTMSPFTDRKSQHLSLVRNGTGSYLHNAIKKHGPEKFTWEILDYCQTIDEMNEREQFWIRKLNALCPNGYNLTTGGMNSIPCEETRRKISEAKSGPKHPMYGKTRSPKTRRKISEALSGPKNPNYGKSKSPKTRRKISEANTGKKRPPETKERMRKRLIKDWAEGKFKGNKGHERSPESRERMSKTVKKLWAEGRYEFHKGQSRSLETKERMRKAHKK